MSKAFWSIMVIAMWSIFRRLPKRLYFEIALAFPLSCYLSFEFLECSNGEKNTRFYYLFWPLHITQYLSDAVFAIRGESLLAYLLLWTGLWAYLIFWGSILSVLLIIMIEGYRYSGCNSKPFTRISLCLWLKLQDFFSHRSSKLITHLSLSTLFYFVIFDEAYVRLSPMIGKSLSWIILLAVCLAGPIYSLFLMLKIKIK